MSMNEPVPKKALADGSLIDGGKMSKSKGNIVDPEINRSLWIDALKYFLLREYTLVDKTGYIPTKSCLTASWPLMTLETSYREPFRWLKSIAAEAPRSYDWGWFDQTWLPQHFDAAKVEAHMDEFLLQQCARERFGCYFRANKYSRRKDALGSAKTRVRKSNLDTVMSNLAEVLRMISVLIIPYMHTTSDRWEISSEFQNQEAKWSDLEVIPHDGWGKCPQREMLCPQG